MKFLTYEKRFLYPGESFIFHKGSMVGSISKCIIVNVITIDVLVYLLGILSLLYVLDPNHTLSIIVEVSLWFTFLRMANIRQCLLILCSQAVLSNHVFIYVSWGDGICIVSRIYFLETTGKSKLAAMGNYHLQAPSDCFYLIRKWVGWFLLVGLLSFAGVLASLY